MFVLFTIVAPVMGKITNNNIELDFNIEDYEIDNVFKTADLNGEEIKLILVSDFNDSVGKWQGIELMIAAKYKAEIYLVNNSIFVSQMLNGMNNNKIIVKSLNFREYKRMR